MDSIEKKLTGMVVSSYHGSMTENGEIKKNIPNNKEAVDGGKVSAEKKDAGGKPVERREAFDWKNLSEKEKKEYLEKIEKMAGESAKKKEPGLFDILMDILKALFGMDDKEAGEIIDNSEAMRGLQAYWRIKPLNKWDAIDYGRVFFMLASDTSMESMGIQAKLETDARKAGIGASEISDKAGEIAKEYRKSYPKQGDSRAISGHEEMLNRAIAMNEDLWEEEKARKEGEFQEGLKKAGEAIGRFTPETQKQISEAIKSGDPEYFKYLLGRFEKYEKRPWMFKRMAENYLSAYEYNKESKIEMSENARAVAELMKKALKDLGVDESDVDRGSGENDTRKKVREMKVNEPEEEDRGARGEKIEKEGEKVKSRREVVEEEIQRKKEEKWKEDVNERIGKVDENTAILVEQGKISIEQREKILETSVRMLDQLYKINQRLDELRGVLIIGLSNPNALKKEKDEYLAKQRAGFQIDSYVNEMAGEKKVVAGGEKDHELYSGNVDQMLAERINRIKYFIEMRKGEEKGDFSKFDKAFLYRMKKFKVYEELEGHSQVSKQEDIYFREIQRWVGTILENTDIKGGDLRLPTGVYKELEKLRVKEDPSADDFEDKLLEKVRILNGEKKVKIKLNGEKEEEVDLKFLEYFKGQPNKVAAVDNYGYPISLEATAHLIAENKGAKWRTGGEYELIDADGNFHRENFLLWMREEINLLIDWDPIAPINAQQGIQFKAGFSQISLFDILYWQQYTQTQKFKMSGDVKNWYRERKSEDFQNGWGQLEPHPEMSYDIRVNGENGKGILLEAWENDHEHKDAAMLNNAKAWSSPDKWLEAREEISQFNNYTRACLAFKRYMEGAHKKNKDGIWEDEAYYMNGEQGSEGKAVQTGHLFFRYFSDWTENYTKKGWDYEKNRETVIEVDRDNMVYQALGHEGSSYFLQSLAESAFDHVDNTPGKDGKNAREEIKGAYRDFIVRRAEKIKNDYKELEGEKKRKMEMLVENFKKKLDVKGEKLDKIKIGLDSYKELTDLKMDIESKVLGKMIVSADDKKMYGWKEKVVVREEVEKEISGEMRGNIKEFFDVVLKQQIRDVPDDKDGLLKGKIRIDPTTGKPVLVKIGASMREAERLFEESDKEIDIFVYTDANGRIVKKSEWDKIEVPKDPTKPKKKKTTVGDIVRDFYEHFEEDQNDLAGYEKDFKPIYMEYERAKKEYDLAVANKSTDIAAKKQAMDDKREKFGKYDKILARSESLGLALLTKVGNRSRDELNMFKRSRTLDNASTFDVDIKRALTKSITKVYGLDEEIEGTYAVHRIWYPLFYMGIAGINNTSGFSGGIQPEAEYANFMKRRISRFDLGTGGGSKETLKEFRSLVPGTFFEWTRVKMAGEGKPEHMLIEILQGAEGKQMKPIFMRNLEVNPAKKYEIPTKSESAFHEDGLKKAEAVRKLIIEDHEHEFEKIVYTDIWGAQRVDHEKALKIFGAWWDNIRQLFNNHGIDFESKISVHGREVKMMDYLFGEDTQKTLGIMKKYYKEHADKLEKKGKKDEADAYRSLADQLKSKPALAVFLNSVTASIHEHRQMWGSYDQWSVGTIDNIWVVLDEYLHQKSGLEYKVNDPKIKERPSMIPYELFNRLLGVHHEDSMEKYMFWDLLKCFVQGFIAGLGEAQKEIEDELKGQPVKQWIG